MSDAQYRLDFGNYLAIVTKERDTAAVRFDGQPVTLWSSAWGYAYAAFPVDHRAHYITVSPRGSVARFTAYAYGHSLVDTSSSAYAFTVAYHSTRTLLANYLNVFLLFIYPLTLPFPVSFPSTYFFPPFHPLCPLFTISSHCDSISFPFILIPPFHLCFFSLRVHSSDLAIRILSSAVTL